MKKRTRKFAAAALAVSLVGVFALFGCSGGNAASSASSSASSSAASAEPVELRCSRQIRCRRLWRDIQTAYIADGHDNVTFADTQYKSSRELNEMLGAGSYADLLISASKGSMDTAVKERGAMLTSRRASICS